MAALFSSFARRGTAAALLCGLTGLLVGTTTPQTAAAHTSMPPLTGSSAACEVAGAYDVGVIPRRYQPLKHTSSAIVHQTTVAAPPAWYGRIVIDAYAGCTNAPTAGTFYVHKAGLSLRMQGAVSAVTAISSSFEASSSSTTSDVEQIAIQPHAVVQHYAIAAGRTMMTTKTTTLSPQNAQLTVDSDTGTVALSFALPAVAGADPMTVTLHGVREMHGVTQGLVR